MQIQAYIPKLASINCSSPSINTTAKILRTLNHFSILQRTLNTDSGSWNRTWRLTEILQIYSAVMGNTGNPLPNKCYACFVACAAKSKAISVTGHEGL
jgi:hypothetical protein